MLIDDSVLLPEHNATSQEIQHRAGQLIGA
jgi:hypothetical protein